jgi:hypothetical protein
VLGKGAGVAPATTTTGTGVVTAIGNATNGTGGLVTFNGNIGTTATGHASLDLALTGGAMTGTITSNVLSTLTATTSSSLGPQITLINEAADTSNPYLILQKGRAGGTTTLSGDTLGAIDFQGFGSGNATAQGPLIAAIMTGAAGTTFVPSDLVFSTATSAALNEQMRITSAGNISIAGNISSVGAITSSGLVALSGHFSQTITGSAGSGNGAVNLAYADSGGISGQYQPFALNFNDNLDNTTDDFDDGLVSVLVVNPANNPTARGGRQALVGAVFLRNPTGSHNNRNYVGVEAAGQADSGDGGTGGSPLGAVFGLGFSGVAGAGAANLLNITGAEGNVSALNNSVYYKSVLQLDNNQGDLYRGTHYDAILSISAQSNSLPNGGWLNGILFSQANGAKPVGTDGTLIATQDSATVFSFIDFSSYTCSGGLAIHTPGFEVSCAGDIQGGYISGINNSMGAYPTSQATSFLIGDNFSGGAGEVNFWNTQNNAGGFSFYQKTGASVATLVAIINGSGNTSVAGSMQVGNLVGSGSRPVCVTSAGVLEAGTLAAGLVTCP